MSTAFSGMASLMSIDLTGIDTSNVTNMLSMFRNCTSLTSLDISSFDMLSVSNMRYFISGCTSLQELDISGCNMSGCQDTDQAFSNLDNLVTVITDEDTWLPSWRVVDFSSSANLTLTSGINILNALPVVDSSSYTYQCMLASAVYTAISSDSTGADAMTNAQNRGWTIQSV